MLDITHLSYSSINTWLLCPRSWKLRYVDKVQTPKSAALVFGSCFHETVESYLRARCLGEPPDILSIWQRLWSSETEGEPIDWGESTREQLSNDGLRLLTHKETIAIIATLQPYTLGDLPAVEHRVELRVPGVPLPVIGFIDLIHADGVPCDFKTSARSWTQEKLDAELQPLFYLAALSQSGFRANPQLRFRHYIFVKTKNPQVQTLEVQHNPAELFWLLDLVRSVWVGIKAGSFPPNTNSWKCSPRYCEYWAICRGGQRA
ncbi:MAG: RecB family exonuclease [Chloroflexota bacterium]